MSAANAQISFLWWKKAENSVLELYQPLGQFELPQPINKDIAICAV